MARNYPSGSSLHKSPDRIFIHQKINNWTGIVLALLIAGAFGVLMAKQAIAGFGLFGLVIGVILVILCMLNAEAGLYINIFYSFIAFGFSRFAFNDTFPVGLVSDALVFATFFGVLLTTHHLKTVFNKFVQTPVVICILILFFYLLIELFNPYAKSFDGWYQTFRKIISSVLLLFIAYNVFTSLAVVKRFLKVVFVVCALTGLYGCIQQWHGLFEYEKAWAMADKVRFGLLFIGGDFRKFSFTSDATAFGVIMSAAVILFIVLGLYQKKLFNKIAIGIGIIFMTLGMAYSGTRTANAMLVAGLFMYAVLTFDNKTTRIFSIVAVVVLAVLIYGPFYSNATLNRFRSTFNSTGDKSYSVREENRKFIQPYIYSHPIGGGLGTTGAAGLKYNPGHYLAGFPTDSGYLKKALESGWIGLLIICVLYFVVMKRSIQNYFASRNKEIRMIYAAITSCIFSFYIAEFPQDAIGQITDVVVYYPMLALVLRLIEFDDTEEKNILPEQTIPAIAEQEN